MTPTPRPTGNRSANRAVRTSRRGVGLLAAVLIAALTGVPQLAVAMSDGSGLLGAESFRPVRQALMLDMAIEARWDPEASDRTEREAWDDAPDVPLVLNGARLESLRANADARPQPSLRLHREMRILYRQSTNYV